MKFRKKPVVIDAWIFTGTDSCIAMLKDEGVTLSEPWADAKRVKEIGGLLINTLEGEHLLASVGDFIIRGIKGEFYPYREDIFLMTYEKV